MTDAPTFTQLRTVLRQYGTLARPCAAERQDHVQVLARLVALEMPNRERRMIERRIKVANFSASKKG